MPVLFQFLTTGGDGTGDASIVGDYSTAPQTFSYVAPDDQKVSVQRLVVLIRDAGSVDAGRYGNNITLTNGLTLHVENDGGGVADDLTPVPIRTNLDWARYGAAIAVHSWGQGDQFVVASWTFTEVIPEIGLFLQPTQALVLTASDDFTNLEDHTVIVQGFTTPPRSRLRYRNVVDG